VLGREQVRFLVLPILPPALLVSCGLALLGQTGNQVRVTGRDALVSERFGHLGDKLQE